MKVFVVICGAYASEEHVVGVYSTLELAENKKAKANTAICAQERREGQYAFVDEWVVDED